MSTFPVNGLSVDLDLSSYATKEELSIISLTPGPKGDNGADGKQGIQGEHGERGDLGPVGPQGETGAKGDAGPAGPQGEQGPPGQVVTVDHEGKQGIEGPVGARGEKGDKGDTGEVGAKGEQGVEGPQGPRGAQGEHGADGVAGVQGPIGETGPKGDKGERGEKGEPGAGTQAQLDALQKQIDLLTEKVDKCCSQGGGDPNKNNVVTDNLLLYLDAASYTGSGNWMDQTTYHHDGQFPGGTQNPSFVSVPNNGSYFNFDYTKRQYFNVINQDTMVYGTGDKPRSLLGWINVQPTGGWQWILSYGAPGTGQSMFIGFAAGMNQIRFGGYNGNDLIYNKTSGTWAGQWVNICGTYSGTTAKLYINGQLAQTGTFTWNTTKGINSIGRQTNGNEFTNGKISYISYYSKVLSDDEVLQNYNAIRVRYGL
jgi:hypothetical protein